MEDVDDRGRPAELLRVYHRRTVRRWHYRTEHGAFDRHLSVGWHPDGWWWVDDGLTLVTQRLALPAWHPDGWWWVDDGLRNGGRVFQSDTAAFAYAERYRTEPRDHPGEWIEVAAETEPGVVPAVPICQTPPVP